jgi:hypothetical protein
LVLATNEHKTVADAVHVVAHDDVTLAAMSVDDTVDTPDNTFVTVVNNAFHYYHYKRT